MLAEIFIKAIFQKNITTKYATGAFSSFFRSSRDSMRNKKTEFLKFTAQLNWLKIDKSNLFQIFIKRFRMLINPKMHFGSNFSMEDFIFFKTAPEERKNYRREIFLI